jgi:hypothetical protein
MKMLKADVQRHLLASEVDRSDLMQSVGDFLRQEFGLTKPDRLGWGAKFAFRLDETNMNVEAAPYVDGMRQWVYYLIISCRAPLVTCLAYTVHPIVEQGERRPGTHYEAETPPRAQAVEWTDRVAQRFALQYVDAATLRGMRVEYGDVAPDFSEAMEHDPDFPSAFNVLFLEY